MLPYPAPPSLGDGPPVLPPVTLRKLPHLSDYIPDLPSAANPYYHPPDGFYISPNDVILRHIVFDTSGELTRSALAYHRAGPRKVICFDPTAVRAAIISCGGLCPGVNTVIRELVVRLWDLYGVREIFGIPSGYRGFYLAEPITLNPKLVHHWHMRGGTALTTSCGGFDLDKIINAIKSRRYNQDLV